MHADSIYMIGATHSVCQDYAVAKDSYIVLSDGCSTSPDTDIGSRLLVKAAEHLIDAKTDLENLPEGAARLALKWAEAMMLPALAVDATLLIALIDDDDVVISCSGDGVIVTETIDGRRDIYDISYPSGYPLYPVYLHQPDRFATMVSSGRSIKKVKHISNVEPSQIDSFDSVTHFVRLRKEAYRFIALMSDGVRSFFTTAERSVASLDTLSVISELVAFKSWNGEFVGRRVKRFMKDCRSRGWEHADDLSMGVLYPGG